MARNKYELAASLVAGIEGSDFEAHVLKHFVSEEEAQKIRDLSGRPFSAFTGKFTWKLVRNVLVNWAEDSDSLYEKILRQTEDRKEYRMTFNTRSVCGITLPAEGKCIECDSFSFYFTVYRNVFWGRAEYDIQVNSVYPTKK